MKIISLLTDFGDKDNFVGVMKAVILKISPKAEIVDICHNVSPQDIMQAAFVLENSFRYFPKGTVHLVVVDPGVGSKRKKILVKTKDYYFVAADNGVLSLALSCEDVRGTVWITNDKYFLKPVSDTFHGRDIFAPVAAYLSLGKKIDDFGKRLKSMKHLSFPKLKRLKDELQGEIIYIDRFGNLITNIIKDEFKDFLGGHSFKIGVANQWIDKISHGYQEGKKNKPLAVFDSFNRLEIAIAQASAKEVLGIDKGTHIQIVKC